MGRVLACSAFAMCTVALSAPLSAEVAVEWVAGQRHRDATRILSPLFAELERRGYRSGRAVVPYFHQKISLPSELLSHIDAIRVSELVKAGRQAWIAGNLDSAATVYKKALALLKRGLVSVVREPALREMRFSAMVGLSLVLGRKNQRVEAEQLMERLICSFPKREVSRLDYGPEGQKLYREVRRRLELNGRGHLKLAAPEDATLFVNERYAGIGVAELDLYPGVYRIFARQGRKHSRVHRVVVAANKLAMVDIDWQLDSVFKTTGPMVGLKSSSSNFAEIARIAGRLATQLGDRELVVVGLLRRDGKPYVRVARVSAEGALLSSASFEFSGAPLSKATIRLVVEQAFTVLQRDPQQAGRGSHLWPWVVVGVGVGLIGTGGYLLAVDGQGSCGVRSGEGECPKNYRTKSAGFVSMGVGAALITSSAWLYLWLSNGKEGRTAVGAMADGQRGWLSIAGQF